MAHAARVRIVPLFIKAREPRVRRCMCPSEESGLQGDLSTICDRLLNQANIPPQSLDQFYSEMLHAFESAKLEALAEFAAGAGHEINNPVATIAGRVQLLLGNETDPERRRALEIIGGQALRIRDMIGDVMLFARPPSPRLTQVDLLEAAQRAIASQADLFAQRAATSVIEIPAGTAWQADRTQIMVLLSSLIRNALEAADRPGITIIFRVAHRSSNDRDWSVLTVSDNGPGIADAIREHIFDPFYSGRQAGRGLGFGLSKCWRIAQMHGGRIELVSTTGSGATFDVWWPEL